MPASISSNKLEPSPSARLFGARIVDFSRGFVTLFHDARRLRGGVSFATFAHLA
jgi:hypothetical protein